jgi:hypothetical protein
MRVAEGGQFLQQREASINHRMLDHAVASQGIDHGASRYPLGIEIDVAAAAHCLQRFIQRGNRFALRAKLPDLGQRLGRDGTGAVGSRVDGFIVH